jgi:hypothetical protein
MMTAKGDHSRAFSPSSMLLAAIAVHGLFTISLYAVGRLAIVPFFETSSETLLPPNVTRFQAT